MPLKNEQTVWVAKLIVLVVVVAGAVLAWRYVVGLRRDVQEKQARLERVPEEQARYAVVEAEVAKRQADVARIRGFTLTREQLADVVGEIEVVGSQEGVSVSIPEVEEKQLVDQRGKSVQSSGLLTDVRLKVVAIGPPKSLLRFLHSVEHMQRLVYLDSWRLDASAQASGRQANLDPDRNLEGQPVGVLSADVIVVLREKTDE